MKIKAKILEIKENPVDRRATVVVGFRDEEGHTWKKEYLYSLTSPIKVLEFKQRVIDDLKVDLKPKTNLDELKSYIGTVITLTI